MDGRCDTCGSEPGAGAFCQHCGAGRSLAPPADADDRNDGASRTHTSTGAAPTPEPTPPLPPPPPPHVVYVQAPPGSSPQPASGSSKGCATGCGVTVIVALLVVAVAGYLSWRWYQANVAPTVEDIGAAFEDGFGEFAEGVDLVGPCYDLQFDDDGIVSSWTAVDCGGPRDAEVFHRWMFRDGSFPGMEALEDEAFGTCVDWFEDYVGVPFSESSLRINWLVPTDTLWSDGSREGVCTVGAASGPLTGPVKGSAR